MRRGASAGIGRKRGHMNKESQGAYELGVQLLQNHDAARAREVLQKALAAEPNEPLLAYPLAVACAEVGDNANAVQLLTALKNAQCLPPAGQDLLRRLVASSGTCTGGGSVIQYVGPFTSWDEARRHAIGYDAPNIVAKVLAATQAVIDGKAAFERDSILFSHEEYNYPFLTSLFAVATKTGGRLRVVDFGGSLGSSYWQNRKLLRRFCSEVSWRVVEQPTYLQAASKLLYLEPLTFYPTIPEACQNERPDAIVFSGVMQYIENYREIFAQAVAAEPEFIVIDRTPELLQSVGGDNPGAIMVQNVSPQIYSASLPCCIYNPGALAAALPGYEALYAYKDAVDGTFTCAFPDGQSIAFDHRGMLLRRK